MKKQPPANTPAFGWKRQRSRHGIEILNYPSDLARQLLLYPAAIGLSDANYFARLFRALTGVTPRAYRTAKKC